MNDDNQVETVQTGIDPNDVYNAVHNAVSEGWPYPSYIREAIYDAIAANTMTVLPPKSYLRVDHDDGPSTHGVALVALRQGNSGMQALSERGDWIDLGTSSWDKTTTRCLVVGR